MMLNIGKVASEMMLQKKITDCWNDAYLSIAFLQDCAHFTTLIYVSASGNRLYFGFSRNIYFLLPYKELLFFII